MEGSWERHTTVNSRCGQERRGTAVAIPPCLPLGSCRYCQRAPQHQMVYDGRKGKHPAHPSGALSAAASTSAPQSSGSPRSLPRMCVSADSRHRRDGGWCAHPRRWSARSCIGPQSGVTRSSRRAWTTSQVSSPLSALRVDSWLSRNGLCHRQGRLTFGRFGRLHHTSLDDQAVTILHEPIPKILPYYSRHWELQGGAQDIGLLCLTASQLR